MLSVGADSPREGWSRTAQDSLDDDLASDLPPPGYAFLDRPVGYVSMRWVVVLVGALVGLIVGVIVADLTIAPEPQTDILANFEQTLVAVAGFILGALVAGLVLVVLWLRAWRTSRG
jgi:hypothetical protein